jgi:drug/metabolite transporter (DMT)-like permease
MTIRFILALLAILCGLAIVFLTVQNANTVIGAGIVLAALAAVVDR